MFRWFFTFVFLLALFGGAPTVWSAGTVQLPKNKIRTEIIFGRVCLLPPEGRNGDIDINSFGVAETHFQLTHGVGGTANVHYEYRSKKYFSWCDCENGFALTELWVDKAKNTYIRLVQTSGNDPILIESGTVPEELKPMLEKSPNAPSGGGGGNQPVFHFGDFHGENVRTYRGESVFHLYLFRNSECAELIQEILSKHTGRSDFIEQQKTALFSALAEQYKNGAAQETVTSEQVQKWIAQLDSEDFNVRRLADGHLRSAGITVLLLLPDFPLEKYSPEVQIRFRQIVSSIEFDPISSDSIAFYAPMWSENPAIWAAMLETDSENLRKTAWEVIQNMYKNHPEWKTVAYDPSLSAEMQQEAIETLKNQTSKEVQ